MKFATRLTIVLVLAVAALAATASIALATGRLVYSDEFNTAFDTTTWATVTPWNTHTDTIQTAYYDPSNVSLLNGSLRITSKNQASNGYAYTSAFLTSSARPKFSYGYFEIRAKLPKGPGIWPAFWLTNDSTLEIDGLEMLGDRPSRIYQTLHENDSQIYQGVKDGPDYSADFHTYGIDWQPGYVKWYIDGVCTASYVHAMPADPLYICLNTAVGGTWPGAPTPATTFPVNYDIDYVHVYDTMPVAAAANTAPVAAADSYSTANATALSVTAPGLLANDTDADGNALSASALTQPAHGTLSLAANGSFTYTPASGFSGTDSFTYRAYDGQAYSATTTVSIAVTAPVVTTPTIVTKPVVNRTSRTRRTYSVAGWVQLGTKTTAAATSAQVRSVSDVATAVTADPVVLGVTIQRYTHSRWAGYRTVSVVNPPARYTTHVALPAGTYRVQTHVSGGDAPSATSPWTGALKVQ